MRPSSGDLSVDVPKIPCRLASHRTAIGASRLPPVPEAFYLPQRPRPVPGHRADPGAVGPRPAARRPGGGPARPGRGGHGDRADLQVARITFDIARPLPIAELEVATRLLRGGRSVELVEATLAADGAEVLRATALRVRTADLPPARGAGPGAAAARAGSGPHRAVLPDRPGGRLPHGHGGAVRGRLVPGAGSGHGLDADAPPPGPRRAAVPAVPGPGRRRLRQRRQRRPRLPPAGASSTPT